MHGDAIAVDQLGQDLAAFEAEAGGELSESFAQGRVALHCSCQLERALVAHEGECAVGMKSRHQALDVTAVARGVASPDQCEHVVALCHVTLPATRIRAA